MRGLLTFIIVMVSMRLWAQDGFFHVGVKGGICKYDYGTRILKISDLKTLDLNIVDEKVGFLGGLVIQMRFNKFIIQPEVLFNTNKVNYVIRNQNFSLADSLLSESYNNLDIPLMLGFKSNILRLNAGPVAHIHLSSTSDLFDISGYEQQFNKFEYGWQAGIGIDFWKIMIDLRYEGNFSKFGDHISIDGKKYSFSERPARLIGTIGLLF